MAEKRDKKTETFSSICFKVKIEIKPLNYRFEDFDPFDFRYSEQSEKMGSSDEYKPKKIDN